MQDKRSALQAHVDEGSKVKTILSMLFISKYKN